MSQNIEIWGAGVRAGLLGTSLTRRRTVRVWIPSARATWPSFDPSQCARIYRTMYSRVNRIGSSIRVPAIRFHKSAATRTPALSAMVRSPESGKSSTVVNSSHADGRLMPVNIMPNVQKSEIPLSDAQHQARVTNT